MQVGLSVSVEHVDIGWLNRRYNRILLYMINLLMVSTR